MKTITVTERVGEYLGPVDWSYDFAKHFIGYGNPGPQRDAACAKAVEWLRQLESAPDDYEATTDGGWPRMCWHNVVSVGMYDGWPYWRPVPSVCLYGTLGSEWHPFHSLTGIERKEAPCT